MADVPAEGGRGLRLGALKIPLQRALRTYAVRSNVTLGEGVHLGMGTIVDSPFGLTIGDDTYIGKGCTIECSGSIGSGVMIANAVGLVGRNDHHVGAVGRSVRRAPWIADDDFPDHLRGERLHVGDDVWIGYGAVVLSGVTIGRGAVVAAGSVVTSDVASYDVVAGVPARPHGRRFTDDEIVEHELALYGDRRNDD